MRTEYIIVADYPRYGFTDCLVCMAGYDRAEAEEILNQMLSNPTKNDLMLINGGINLRIDETEAEDNWWNKYGTN